MGLISRLRHYDSDRRRSMISPSPSPSPSPSHKKASESLSSSTSDFSHTSLSSVSSQDSGNRTESLPKNKLRQNSSIGYPASHRNSMPVFPTLQPAGEPRKRENFAASPSRSPKTGKVAPSNAPSNAPQTIGQNASGYSPNKARSAGNVAGSKHPHRLSLQPHQMYQPPQASQAPQAPYPQTHQAPQTPRSPRTPQPYSPVHQTIHETTAFAGDETQISISEESETEDSQDEEGIEVTSDGESESGFGHAQNHPYYEQWKQYYQVLEMQKQQGVSAQSHAPASPISQKGMYPGMSNKDGHSGRFYNKVHLAESEDSLVLNSRRSTIRSNRSASVPSSEVSKAMGNNRAISVNVASADKLSDSRFNATEEMYQKPGIPKPRNISANSVTSRLTQLSMASNGTGQISDYAAFIMSDDSDSETTTIRERAGASEEAITEEAPRSMLSESNGQDHYNVTDFYQQPGALELDSNTSALNRNASTASSNSYSSLQSEKNFIVGPSLRRVATPSFRKNSSGSKRRSRNSQSKKFVPPMSGPPPPIVATPQPQPLEDAELQRRLSNYKRQSTSSLPVNNAYMNQIQHSIQQVRQFQNSQQNQQEGQQQAASSPYMPRSYYSSSNLSSVLSSNLPSPSLSSPQLPHGQNIHQYQQMAPHHHNHHQIPQSPSMTQFQQISHPYQMGYPTPGPVHPGWSTDAFINRKIEEFVQLRTIIASGNKTFEYRLKWLQMLVSATNNKLFAYINIKGEGIPTEQVAENKQFFIRSSVSHLEKLLREFSRSDKKDAQRLYAEACFIQGCLHSNAYLDRFGQDFNYELNVAEAERYFHICLGINPGFFRAYYELGELYESQQEEDQFDLALENYTESAKMGYNRAIYKIALIYLLVPKARSTKFLSFFKRLAAVDMESNDVQLNGADRDELEEIVGLAHFQLGKIHEGIYPGDLKADDQFVRASLNIAPVVYSKSLTYYNKAAKLGCVQAQVRLGRVYEEGELDREYNPKKSVQWYMRASSSPLKFKRHPEAMLGLSRWLMKGTHGASKHIPYADPEQAVQWCERACKEFDYAEAYYQMALYVEQGYASGDAEELFERAWRGGHALAGRRLGM